MTVRLSNYRTGCPIIILNDLLTVGLSDHCWQDWLVHWWKSYSRHHHAIINHTSTRKHLINSQLSRLTLFRFTRLCRFIARVQVRPTKNVLIKSVNQAIRNHCNKFFTIFFETPPNSCCFIFYSVSVVNIPEVIKNRRIRVLPSENFCFCKINPLSTHHMNFFQVFSLFSFSFKFFFEFISALFKTTHFIVR
jgi:hypothetical protein